MTEAQLIQQARAGDAGAWEAQRRLESDLSLEESRKITESIR